MTFRKSFYAAILVIIALALFSYHTYRTKAMYQGYITDNLNTDLHSLAGSIQENDKLYMSMLETGAVTSDQSRTLMYNNEKVRDIITAYRSLALSMHKRKDGYQYAKSEFNADRLAHLFYDWHEGAKGKETALRVDQQRQAKLAKQLNDVWLETAMKSNATNFKANRSAWLHLLDDLESGTVAFLQKNKAEDIEEIWRRDAGQGAANSEVDNGK